MNGLIKTFIIVSCLVVCATGAVIAPIEGVKTERQKPDATPVKNREAAPRVWIQA